MSRLGSIVAALALVAIATQAAEAFDDLWVSGALTSDYLRDTGRDASVFDSRLELDAGLGPVTLGVVYRAYQLSDPAYDPARLGGPVTGIKHRYAEFSQETFSARVGNFFSTFGHGITLRSYEDVELEHDTALDGVLAEARLGGVDVAALSGVATEPDSRVRDHHHTINGARVGVPVAVG